MDICIKKVKQSWEILNTYPVVPGAENNDLVTEFHYLLKFISIMDPTYTVILKTIFI